MILKEQLEEARRNGYASVKGGILVSQKFVDDITAAAVTTISDVVHDIDAVWDGMVKPTYPKDHVAGMHVPKGGSNCAKCEYLADNKTDCTNKYFQKWNGSPVIPGKIDEYCSDWFEAKDIDAAEDKGWHAVDLDGTIANYTEFKGETHIGDPIEGEALNKLRGWLKKGETVKIFTARAGKPEAVKAIEKWCIKHLGQKLEVTNKKDPGMIDLLDDRAHRVKKNTGEIVAAEEQSFGGDHKGSLWNDITLVGFSGPEEEALRAMLSRIPPELLTNVVCIQSAKELNAKHGRYISDEKKILFNPGNLALRQRFGGGELSISHADLTLVHEVGHSLFDNLSPEEKQKWEAISRWIEGKKDGQAPPYKEIRPGWEHHVSKWTHRAGVKFPRYYSEKSPNEDFADCFSFFLMNKAYRIGDDKRKYFEDYIKVHIKRYPQISIQSPVRAAGTTEGALRGWDTRGRGRKPYEKVASRIHQLVTENPRHYTARRIGSRFGNYGPDTIRQALSHLQRNRFIRFERTEGTSGRGQYVIVPRRPFPTSAPVITPDRYSPWQHPAPPVTSPSVPSEEPRPTQSIGKTNQGTGLPIARPVPDSVRTNSGSANAGLAALRDGQWHSRQEFDNAVITHNDRQGYSRSSFDPESRIDILRDRLPSQNWNLEQRYAGTSPKENQLRVVPSGISTTPSISTPQTVQAPSVPVNVPNRIENPAPGQRQPVGFLTQEIVPSGSENRSRVYVNDFEKFQSEFGMSPSKYRDVLLKGIDPSLADRTDMNFSRSRGEAGKGIWQVKADGPGFEVSRSIDLGNKTVYHGYFTMNDSMQGHGFAKTIFANSLDLYDHLGIKNIGVSASLAGGGYAWARFGFVPDQASWRSLAYNTVWKADRDSSITPDIKAQVRLISKIEDPKAIWLMAGLKDAKGESVGAKLLRGTDWHGKLDLNNPEQYAIVRDYSGRTKR